MHTYIYRTIWYCMYFELCCVVLCCLVVSLVVCCVVLWCGVVRCVVWWCGVVYTSTLDFKLGLGFVELLHLSLKYKVPCSNNQ